MRKVKYMKVVTVKPEVKHSKKERKISMTKTAKVEVIKTANFSDFAPVNRKYTRAEMDCIWEKIVCEMEGRKIK